MAPLTYARLITRLSSLREELPLQRPGDEHIQHRNELQAVLESALAVAQAGLAGDEDGLTAAQLKHRIVQQIGEISDRFETPSPPASPAKKMAAVKKRSLRSTTAAAGAANAGVKKSRHFRAKTATPRSADEQAAAAALLDLFNARPPTPVFNHLPANASSNEHFLAGVNYTLDSLRMNLADVPGFLDRFPAHVQMQLGMKGKDNISAKGKGKEVVRQGGQGDIGGSGAAGMSSGEGQNAGMLVGRSFWNVI